MAKKKKTTSRRKSRVSGIGSNGAAMTLAGVALGVVGSRLITNSIGDKIKPQLLAAGKVGAGLFGAMKLGKNPLIAGIAYGVGASGAVEALQSFGVIKGTETIDVPVIVNGEPPLVGYNEDPADRMNSVDVGDIGDIELVGDDEIGDYDY